MQTMVNAITGLPITYSCPVDGCTIWAGHAGQHLSVCPDCWHETCRCGSLTPVKMNDKCIKGCGSENWECECKPTKDDIIAYGDDMSDGSWEGNTWGAFWRFLEAWSEGMEVWFENEEGLQRARIETVDNTDPQLPFSVEWVDEHGDEDSEWVKQLTIQHFVISEEI